MKLSIAERVYPHLPVLLQNAACWYEGHKEARIRFGPEFHSKLEQLLTSEKWSASEIEAYQNERLRDLVQQAYDYVPFYRTRMQARKLTPADIRTRQDLPKLPVLTREDVRQNSATLVSTAARKADLILRHTSGTTGASLYFYSTRQSIAFQWAVWWRHRMRFGLTPSMWHVNFTGKLATPPGQAKPPYWRWNPAVHEVLINMHHLNPAKIGAVVDFLNSREFDFYSGYPSVVHAMAAAALECGLALRRRPKVVSTGAENMLDFQRRDIAEFTGATITDTYGCSEGCGNASQCPSAVYHEDSEFCILELADPVRESGASRGALLCTGFANSAFPMIRYEVGDIGVRSEQVKACACGRQAPLLTGIIGRIDDYVITPEGTRIMRFDYVFKDTVNVREAQVVQDRPGQLRIRIVRRPAYGSQDEAFIAGEIARWISPRLALQFEYVNEIEREGNGKFRAVRSNLHATARNEQTECATSGA